MLRTNTNAKIFLKVILPLALMCVCFYMAEFSETVPTTNKWLVAGAILGAWVVLVLAYAFTNGFKSRKV